MNGTEWLSRGAVRGKAFGTVRSFLRGHRWLLIGWALSLAISTAATLAMPMILRKVLIDDPADGRTGVLFLGMACASLLLAAATASRYLFVAFLGDSAVSELRVKMFAHLLKLDMQFFALSNTADLCARMGADVEVLEALLCGGVSITVRSVLAAVGSGIAMVFTIPLLSAVSATTVPVTLFIVGVLGPRIRLYATKVQESRSRSSVVVAETFGCMHLMKAYCIEPFQFGKYSNLVSHGSEVSRSRVRVRAILTFGIIVSTLCIFTLTLWMGRRMVVSGSITAGALTQFVIYAFVLASSIMGLAEVWGDLLQARGAADRARWVFEHSAARAEDIEREVASENLECDAAVRFDDVSFRHAGQADDVIRNVSFSIGRGEIVAIVGPSGAGKSTLFYLMLRLFDPASGRVIVQGRDGTNMSLKELRGHFALVPQDAPALAASVADNIRLDSEHDDFSAIREASRIADADEFILAMKDGYETQLGERGVGLSGGQKQRIALARAVYRDAPVLLMDEATSSLDARSEGIIQRAIASRRGRKATVLIAHRLSTVISADVILVLDRGRIVGQGTHTELMADCPLYAALARTQFACERDLVA
jgi:ATP-binding cassette subfamily B protein